MNDETSQAASQRQTSQRSSEEAHDAMWLSAEHDMFINIRTLAKTNEKANELTGELCQSHSNARNQKSTENEKKQYKKHHLRSV